MAFLLFLSVRCGADVKRRFVFLPDFCYFSFFFFANTEKRADGVDTWPARMTHSLAGTGLIDVTLLCLFFWEGGLMLSFFLSLLTEPTAYRDIYWAVHT